MARAADSSFSFERVPEKAIGSAPADEITRENLGRVEGPVDRPHQTGDPAETILKFTDTRAVGLFRSLMDKVFSSPDNRPFGSGERQEIRQQLDELRSQVSDLTELTREQNEALRKLVTDARESSERLGRKDWIMAGIGAGTALVITGAVPAGAMVTLGVKAYHALAHLFTE
jgi:hypothetical protein